MQLSESFIKSILKTLNDSEEIYLPVALLAKRVQELENPEQPETLTLSNKLVNALLHLQDLRCFENSRFQTEWGYQPFLTPLSTDRTRLSETIYEAVNNNSTFETRHSYKGADPESLIRINANGRQLLEILENNNLPIKIKRFAINFGVESYKAILPTIFSAIPNIGTSVIPT